MRFTGPAQGLVELDFAERYAAPPDAGDIQVHVQPVERQHGRAGGVLESESPDLESQGERVE
jgi:hypothetical protein